MPKRIVVVENLVVQPLNNEAVALDVNHEIYYTLNPSAYYIWQVLTRTASLEEAIQELLAYFDISEARLRQEVDTFVTELRQMKLIEIIDD